MRLPGAGLLMEPLQGLRVLLMLMQLAIRLQEPLALGQELLLLLRVECQRH